MGSVAVKVWGMPPKYKTMSVGHLFTELVGQCFVHAAGNIQVGRTMHFTQQLHSLFTMMETL